MGCDIHIWAEVKKDGKWQKVGKVFKNTYYEPGKPNRVYEDEDGYESNPEMTDEPYQGRSYSTFSILANVRNGYGFAGCDTGNGFLPIAFPRGIPSDVSAEARACLESYDVDGHSHSYLTLAEIKAYNWQQYTVKRGWVDADGFKEFVADGKPSSYSGGVSGGKVSHVSNETMKSAVAAGETTNLYTQVEWRETYAESAHSFLVETVSELEKLGSPDEVRIVFFFDN